MIRWKFVPETPPWKLLSCGDSLRKDKNGEALHKIIEHIKHKTAAIFITLK